MNSRVKKQFKSWGSLMYKHNKTEAERLLIQAVAMLSTQLAYDKWTPDGIYEEVCRQAQGLYL